MPHRRRIADGADDSRATGNGHTFGNAAIRIAAPAHPQSHHCHCRSVPDQRSVEGGPEDELLRVRQLLGVRIMDIMRPLLHAQHLLDGGHLLERLHDGLQHLAAPLVMSVFTTTKSHVNLDFVFAAQERLGLTDLEVDVVIAGLGPQADLLQLSAAPFAASALFLVAFVLGFPMVHDAADRRTSVRGHLDQIESRIDSQLSCGSR